ncbi:MAG: SEC-C domain-containing protein, partial [Methyloprofundus sp.]|nr:SEC-C domain-containing protein [Methyloprofundus sp.]
EQWNISGLEEHLKDEFETEIPIVKMLAEDTSLHEESLRTKIIDIITEQYAEKEEQITADVIRHFEKSVMLQVLDNSWKEHLASMDSLRQGIHFRGYAQKDPKQEYKREAFDLFTALLDQIKYEVIGILSKVKVTEAEDVDEIDEQRQAPQEMHFEHAEAESALDPAEATENVDSAEPDAPFVRVEKKVGRNEPCPCGSGKKYKQCHGKLS